MPISRVNGPGQRFVVWVQGCSRKCAGCFNPMTHERSGGYEKEVSEIAGEIPLGEISGITVSGGEPFEQAEELVKLLEAAGRLSLNRMVYTGYTYEELASKEEKAVKKCLKLTDILVDGAYEEKIASEIRWAGSGNQRVMELSNGEIERVYGKKEKGESFSKECELIIDSCGEITATGLIDSIFLE